MKAIISFSNIASASLLLPVLGCASLQPSPERLAGSVTNTSCVARITPSILSVLGQSRDIRLPIPRDWEANGLAENGKTIVATESELSLDDWSVNSITPPLPGTLVDVSSDGTHVLLINKDNNQLQIYDRNKRTALPVVKDSKMGAISPDGVLVVAQVGERVKVVREGKVIFEEDGILPSWIDESTISFFAPEGRYVLIDLPSKSRRTLGVVGRPFVSLQRSAGGALMYVTRTRADFWSADFTCPERYRVIVHEREQVPGVLFAVGCKGSPSTSIRWINNANVCSTRNSPEHQDPPDNWQ